MRRNIVLFVVCFLCIGWAAACQAADVPAQTGAKRDTLLYVKTVPPGAKVFLDGKEIGSSDDMFHVAPGVGTVHVELDGHKPTDRQVTIRAAGVTRIELLLKQKEEAEGVVGKAISAAEEWLKLTDAGKYAESWDEAATIFKGAVTKDGWEAAVKKVRDPLGKVKSRKLKSSSLTDTLPGAPNGKYVIIQFATDFERMEGTTETITPMLESDGSWKVSGYYCMAMVIAGTKKENGKDTASVETRGDAIRQVITTISQCTETDPRIEEAMKSLKGLKESEVVAGMIPYLDSSVETVRRSAIFVLWNGKFSDITPAVAKLQSLMTHEEIFTRGMSALALGQNKVAASYDALVKMTTDDESGYARRCGAIALGWLGDKRAIPTLEAAMKDGDPMVQANAKVALMLLQDKAPKGPIAMEVSNQESNPKIVSMNPVNGAKDVDPGMRKLQVTFNVRMAEGFSWCGGGPNFPTIPKGKMPTWSEDRKTCTLPVQLKPNWKYHLGLNASSFKNFKSESGIPLDPVEYTFKTRGKDAEKDTEKDDNQEEEPKIVSMNPANGATDVDPGLRKLRVTFSVPMASGFSWCGGGANFPTIPKGKTPKWSDDRKTCTLPVELKPDWEYQLGLNAPSFKGFQSKDGVPLEPVLYTFKTRGAGNKSLGNVADEKAADSESDEAKPVRTWSDATGAFSIEARFGGVEDGKVVLEKTDGKTAKVPLEKLSNADLVFVANLIKAKSEGAEAEKSPAKSQELSHDNGKTAGKLSINGGGHAVRFKVDGDSYYVTSVSLHGSRYGEPRPPKEDFKVWICDSQFKPIATFNFPYSSYTRGNPDWKKFRISPTLVPPEFIVCFGFNPHQTKGVYVSHDGQSSKTSTIGVPGESESEPFPKGNWLIRCKVEKREKGEQNPLKK